jgi:hypothetical protein
MPVTIENPTEISTDCLEGIAAERWKQGGETCCGQKKPREQLAAAYGIRAPGAVALGTLRPRYTETI